jgi:hypothetical protein
MAGRAQSENFRCFRRFRWGEGSDPHFRSGAARFSGSQGGPPKPAKPPKVCSVDLDLGLHDALDTLDGRCPDHVESDRWRQAVEDGGRFLATWGERAEALGWTARDLSGLHQPPQNPHPTYSRLSRRDEAGLCWLLEGREVAALTADTAAIRWPGGSVTMYYRL